MLSHAVDPLGILAGNPCEGIKGLYGGGHRSEIIWHDADIAALKRVCSVEIAHAVDLAATTGLRLNDLVRLSWWHVSDLEIVIKTSKSRQRQEARIPIYDALRAVLTGIPKRSTTVLTNSLGRPWTANSLGGTVSTIKKAAGLAALHFHDLRGTAATRFYVAGLPERAIAEIMGWEEEHVAKIIRRYVDRTAATKAIIAQLNERSLPIRLLPTPPTCRVLPGSGVKLCVGRCGDVARDAEQGTEGVERIEPPVEAEGEFVEVGLQVLVTDPVMDAVQPRFQVCEDEMDDWQILLGDLRIAPFSDGEVFVAALGKAGVAAPVVGDERRARHNGALHEAAERLALRSGTMASRTRPA